ncbi:hypothetical protein [Burkholderia cenocepacia]|uniref:hypothetical protein n=1 Tax=Burkholderia cenocepacia TaxID=95486 RepID=UPI002862C88C|nr:hypothetical protein [Burkholderia cenocepacia]MDR8057697.1 hypothetical protein [Burkholderia cenocepacia]MDR8062211.1 hypothetical protein [Burkholderia cenocepacia]
MPNRHARFFNAFLFGPLGMSLVAIAALITTAATAPRAHAAGVGSAPTITLGVPLATVGPVCSGDPYAALRPCVVLDRVTPPRTDAIAGDGFYSVYGTTPNPGARMTTVEVVHGTVQAVVYTLDQVLGGPAWERSIAHTFGATSYVPRHSTGYGWNEEGYWDLPSGAALTVGRSYGGQGTDVRVALRG